MKNVPHSQQLTTKQGLSRARRAIKQGNTAAALQLYNSVLQHQPNHPVAKKELRKLQKSLPNNHAVQVEKPSPSQHQLNSLVNLYHSGQLLQTERACRELLQAYPHSLVVINILGVALQGQGKLSEAVASYDKAIQLKPDYAEAYYNLGNALTDLGQLPEAVLSYDKTIQFKPEYAEAYYNRGSALTGLGQLSEAVLSYDKAIQLKPDSAEAYVNRGNVLKDLGQLPQAVLSYDKAIQLKPDLAEAYNNRGNALEGLGKLPAAVASYEQAIQFKPDFAEAYANHGNALRNSGRLSEAVESYNKALQLKPDSAETCSNRGNVLLELGQLPRAVESYDKAIQLKPDFAAAYSNRGNALRDLGRLQEAITSYEQAIQLKPELAEAWSNRGNVLRDVGRLQEAVASHDASIQLKPDNAIVYTNRGNALKDLGRLQEAVASHDKSIQLNPEYVTAHFNRGDALEGLGQLQEAVASYCKAIQLKPDFVKAYDNLLLTLNYISNNDVNEPIALARKFGVIVTSKAQSQLSPYQCPPMPGRLRVGFVSGDLCIHPVGYFLEGILSSMDSSKIELIAYPTTFEADDLSERIKPFFSSWKPIYGQNDEAVAKLIVADGVHVLIDLSGHTAHNRLPVFAYKPAPVQVSWLGYFATTGVNEMDYLLGDPYVTPPEDDEQFTEKAWRLPETRWCFTPPNADVEISVPPALNNGYVTFGCFNNLTKVNDKVVELWANVLAGVSNSRLLLKAKQFREQSVRESVIQRFAAQGIDSNHITLEGPEARRDYFAAYNRIDITLDPFPFTGGTTSVESLWMGVPLITLAGDSLVSRQGVGILMNAGLADWIADDEEEYLAKAILFASDLGKLARLREGLRSQVLASPLFDAPRFARNFEDALLKMWNQRAYQS